VEFEMTVERLFRADIPFANLHGSATDKGPARRRLAVGLCPLIEVRSIEEHDRAGCQRGDVHVNSVPGARKRKARDIAEGGWFVGPGGESQEGGERKTTVMNCMEFDLIFVGPLRWVPSSHRDGSSRGASSIDRGDLRVLDDGPKMITRRNVASRRSSRYSAVAQLLWRILFDAVGFSCSDPPIGINAVDAWALPFGADDVRLLNV